MATSREKIVDDHFSASKSFIVSPDHRGKKKKKRRKKAKDIFNVPGVVKVKLSELAQKIIGCVAGVDVTTENPWTFVNKELVQDNLELHEESSEFLPIRNEVVIFPRPQLLIGYVPDESRDYDEFYICVTEKATDEVTAIIEKMKKEQEMRLNNAISKTIKEWASQGSEAEVDEAILKNNRPLIEVEVETRYPIFPEKVQFKIVKVQQRRDGYMELRSLEESFVNLYKKRIDTGVQVAPHFVSAEAQTNCTYPSNSATQYLYEVEENQQLLERCKTSIRNYANENMENISDILTVNGELNLYTDDYSSLSNCDESWLQMDASDSVEEYMSFMEVGLCKGKKIAHAVWHPMMTGTVAVAYADAAPNDYFIGQNNEDTVMRAVHGVNPVLIWNTSDALKPKLILESPREVHKLSFCPFDENILIGGCKDGQVIIWDIRNRLDKVEELEVLTAAQQKYRFYMNSLMSWMKDVHDLALVRPTAVSDPRYCHRGPITGISWMSPFYEFTKIGNLIELPEDTEQTSMQFLTCSEAGNVMIWDLLKKPKVEPGGYKVKKLKRLKKKPSALTLDISPYQALHLTLKPLYKISLRRNMDKDKPLPIANCHADYCRIRYAECSGTAKKTTIEDRAKYRPVLRRDTGDVVTPTIHLGTVEGDYVMLKWEGQDFDSGEVVNSETGQLVSAGKFHDGPISCIQMVSGTNLILCTGGRIFSLWRDDFRDRPILWRRCKHKLTSGKFNMFQPYMFNIQLMNGKMDTWILASSSKYPLKSSMYSSQYLTVNAIHPLQLKKNIFGTGDGQGAFRLFFLGSESPENVAVKVHNFRTFIDREVERKKAFIAWQEEWNKRHDGWIQVKEDELRQRRDKEEEERRAKAAEMLKDDGADKAVHKGPQPGKFIEWMMEQRQLEREARIRSMIISKKQLDTKELEKRRKPLQKLEEENEMKKRKQKQRLKDGETIFHTTVAALFPEMVKEKPPPPPDPYAGGDLPDRLGVCYSEYQELSREADNFIRTNAYNYEFNWRLVLEGGKFRRRMLNEATSLMRGWHVQKQKRKANESSATLDAEDDVDVSTDTDQ